MLVELRDHIGRNIATGKMESVGQCRVWIDGKPVGYIGWGIADKLILMKRYGPIEMKEIETKVAAMMERTVVSTTKPDVPAELLKPRDDEYGEEWQDDFDESGAIEE